MAKRFNNKKNLIDRSSTSVLCPPMFLPKDLWTDAEKHYNSISSYEWAWECPPGGLCTKCLHVASIRIKMSKKYGWNK